MPTFSCKIYNKSVTLCTYNNYVFLKQKTVNGKKKRKTYFTLKFSKGFHFDFGYHPFTQNSETANRGWEYQTDTDWTASESNGMGLSVSSI